MDEQQRRLRELNGRRAFCLFCIRTVSETPDTDPRKASALEEYNRQLKSIDGKIAEITGKPPDIVIGLKPAVIFGKAQ